jgi:hypothetical protein
MLLERIDATRARVVAGLPRQESTRATPDAVDWVAKLDAPRAPVITWLEGVAAAGSQESRVRGSLAILRLYAIYL